MSDSLQETQTSNYLSTYEIDSPIGRGAGSFVYKVRNRKTKQFAALKVIEKKGSDSEKIKQRIQNEIQVHSSLQHENIVTLIAHFEDNDNYYLLLELCEGGELYNLVKQKGRLNDNEVRNYGLQFANALQYLHNHNILHRDLKLSNLLLTDQNILKVCDFGLAVKLTDMRPERDTICGTPNYISPEILKQESYGIKADTWSFGCILYAMATGSPPFEGNSVKETLAKVQSGGFTVPEDISPQLRDLLKHLITIDPKSRFDIENILAHPFFGETALPPVLKVTKSLPAKLVIHQNSSMSFGDPSSLPLETETTTLATEDDEAFDFDLSSNSYVQRLLRQQQQQKSASASSTPLLRNPLDTGKTSASKFSLGGHSPYMNDKENLAYDDHYENYSPVHANSLYNQRQDIKKKHKATSKSIMGLELTPEPYPVASKQLRVLKESLSLNNPAKTDDQSKSKPLRMLDLNIQSNLTPTPKNYTPSNFSTKNPFASVYSNEDKHQRQNMNINTNISPLNTQGLKPAKLKIKGGIFEVAEDGWICIDLENSKRKIRISPDGIKIEVEKCTPFRLEKSYLLSNMPSKYLKFYTYASQVCETMRTRVPRIKIEDSEGRFCLTKNVSSNEFEARFVNGEKVYHTVSSNNIRVQMRDGRIYNVNVLQDSSLIDKEINSVVKKALEKMNLCIEKGNAIH